MVFKKPYAFLIKHFRAIHLAMTALLIYLAFRIIRIVNFFGTLAKSGYYSSVNLAGSYINLFMYFALILVLCIAIFVYMLMRNKKKDTRYYVIFLIYYIFVFAMFMVVFSILQGLEKEVVSAQAARMYRDLSLLFSLPQYFFIVYTFLRGCGFNLKKFNFQVDLKEMEIEAGDDEEIELTVGVETYKAKRVVRRFIREFKYYVLENTFVFICILSVVSLIAATAIFLNVNVYNKVYKENKVFTYKAFNLKVNSSYITDTDYRGNKLTNGKVYLIVSFNILNKLNTSQAIKMSDFKLRVSTQNIAPTKTKNQYFSDLGLPYADNKIKGGTEANYLLIYELDNRYVRDDFIIKILDSIDYSAGDIKANYKDVRVRPINLSKIDQVGIYKQQEEVSLKESLLKNSTIKIKGYNLTSSYKYEYEFCLAEDDCRTSVNVVTPNYTTSNAMLLVLDYELNIDSNSVYASTLKNKATFFNQFAKIRYTKNKETKTIDVKNLTPKNLDGKVIIQIDSDVKGADNYDLVLTIRNKEYFIKIK